MKILSIVIPSYNESNYIVKTIQRVLEQNVGGFNKELIIIDDGSQDDTSKKIIDFLQSNKFNTKSSRPQKKYFQKDKSSVTLISYKKNSGKGNALKSGFLLSKGEIVIVQDADLEYSPADYPLLLQPFVKENADAVYGSRFISHAPHRVLYFWHSIGNRFITGLSNMLTNLNLTDMETGYKAFRGDIIRSISPKLSSRRFGFEPEITARLAKIKNLKIYEVGISYTGRTYAEGKKIQWKDGLWAIFQIIKYNLFIR